MSPNNNDGLNPRDVWNLIDDVGYAHHIMIWMVVLELEREGIYPINTPTVYRRLFKWTGELPPRTKWGTRCGDSSSSG